MRGNDGAGLARQEVVVKFRSADQAVRFAYRLRERAEYARVDYGSVRGPSQGLSPLELHGESAVILSKIKAMPSPERESVMAMYGDRGERAEAMVALGDHIMPMVAGDLPDRRTLQVMLLHWASRRPSIRTVARERSVSYRQVCKWRASVASAWIPIHARAMERLESCLFGPGGFERD